MRFRAIMLFLCVLSFSACTTSGNTGLSAQDLFIEDLAVIASDIRIMYDEVNEDYLNEPFLHIAFADIDFDGIPEFFYGYQTMSGAHNKIWYRAYSLSERATISSEHVDTGWNTYIQTDTDCAFFTGPDHFMEGYYLKDNGEPCFVTKTPAGTVTQPRLDYVFIEYSNSKFSIRTGNENDEALHEVKQVWSQTNIDSVINDIAKLLNEYSS